MVTFHINVSSLGNGSGNPGDWKLPPVGVLTMSLKPENQDYN
jgi:hypothetical protein